MAAAERKSRDIHGRFRKIISKNENVYVENDHNFGTAHMCVGVGCPMASCPLYNNIRLGKYASREGWKKGRRIMELGVLLSELKVCKKCRLGPVPLTFHNIIGELQKGLAGYLYVACQNPECGHINMVPYGQTHRVKKTGAPCFVVNTKLGTGKYYFFLQIYSPINDPLGGCTFFFRNKDKIHCLEIPE